MPLKLKFDRRVYAIAILLIAVALDINFGDLISPFWQHKPASPLNQAIACARQFSPNWQETTRIGYFLNRPQARTFFTDNRSAYQLQMQYALVPHILDSRPETIQVSPWVIGYFTNDKIPESEAQALAPELGLQIETVCENYVLFRRGE